MVAVRKPANTLGHRLEARPAEPAWNARTHTQSPLADAAWIRCFADAFGETPDIVTQVRGSELAGGLALVRNGGLARAWISMDNEHNPYWLGPGEPADARAFLTYLLEHVEYIYLRRLPVESAMCRALREAAGAMGLKVAFLESEAGDARMVLEGTWDEFRARLPRNFQRDLPRKQRQLAKQGALTFSIMTAPGPELAAALAECYDIETRGWKGTDGSPINRDPRTLRFYTELAQALAANDRFALYRLALDGKTIAFEYSLRGGGHIEMLKLSFDPAFASASPGQVLRMMLLQHEVERGEVRYYHLGRNSEWKLRWATEVSPLCTLRIYAPTARGRAAYYLGPVLRTTLKQSPLAMRARDRLFALRDRFKR